MTDYDRPNTVSGLMAKLKELSDLRERHRAEVEKLTADIDHLKACIRLFEGKAHSDPIRKYVTKHRAKKGAVKRFILNVLREASAPMTSRELTELWVQDRGLNANAATKTAIRKRIGACLRASITQGAVKCVGQTTEHGEHGPYKLWAIKRGD
jgi:hypothetical protein